MGRSGPIEPLGEPLSDGVMTVRMRREDDLDAIMSASHDPETRRWLQDPPMDDEARRTSMSRVAEAWRTGTATPLVIADALTDEPVGNLNLQFKDDDVATIAYAVYPAHRGRGIAPRAVQLVSGWALGALGLKQLILEADAENLASIRVAEKCGFERLDDRLEEDGEHTTAVFSRTAG